MGVDKDERILQELSAIKNLLILLLQKFEVKGSLIANALGISQGRLSQILPTKTYKKNG